MGAKERIDQLERQLAEMREELSMVERLERLETEQADLKRRLAARRQPLFQPSWQPNWPTPPYAPTPIWAQTSAGQMTSGQQYGTTYNNTVTHLFTKRDDGPPDMAVPAAV